jgi:hypothetical protein
LFSVVIQGSNKIKLIHSLPFACHLEIGVDKISMSFTLCNEKHLVEKCFSYFGKIYFSKKVFWKKKQKEFVLICTLATIWEVSKKVQLNFFKILLNIELRYFDHLN